MTERPPPSLGTYRPPPRDGEDPREPRLPGGDGMPRIVTSRLRDGAPPPRNRGRRPPPPPTPEPEGTSWLRIVAYVLLGLAAFAAAAAVAAVVLLPTDLIRDRLQAEVKARTGRDLLIAGRSSLTLWPRPAVSIRDVTLSSPPEMGAQPLITVAEIEVAVQILPLLLHDVTVDRLVLRRPVIDLRVDASGRRSWDFADAGLNAATPPIRLAQAAPANTQAAPANTKPLPKDLPKELQDFVKGSTDGAGRIAAPNLPTRGKLRVSDVSLNNVGIVDGTIRYRDARTATDETLSALNATLTLANIASPLNATSDFNWRGEPVQLTAQISPFRALVDGRPIQALIKSTAAPLAWSYDGTINISIETELDGRLTANATAIDRLSRWTGRPLAGSLPGALQIDAKVKQANGAFALNDAQLTFGPLAGRGTISIETKGARPFVRGAIHVATLDLNALQAIGERVPATAVPAAASALPSGAPPLAAPPLAAPPLAAPKSIEDLLATPAPAAPAAPALPQVRGYTKRDGWSDAPLDLTVLGLADADLKLGFDKVLWQDVATGAGQIGLALKAKSARLTLEDVQLYDGRARGIITLDGSATDAIVGGNLVVDGVSALPFLKAMAGFDWLAGRTRIAIAVAGRGTTERQIVSTLNGKADIAVADGALMGLNVSTIVRNVTQSLGQGKLGGLERSPTEKTDFSEFAASAQITNGIARNDDLRITSQQIRATGAGTIDLPQRSMDYLLRPKLTAAAGLEVPLKIIGPLDKPTVTADTAALMRDPGQAVQAIQELAKTPAGREIQETVKGLINDPNARAKARGFLDQFLKK